MPPTPATHSTRIQNLIYILSRGQLFNYPAYIYNICVFRYDALQSRPVLQIGNKGPLTLKILDLELIFVLNLASITNILKKIPPCITNGKIRGANQVFVQNQLTKVTKNSQKIIDDVLRCLLYHFIKFKVKIHQILRDTKM